ncbi:MAG: cell division protein FtsA [Oscillospiraceae bacterium]|nr:cell division protein FtsA [Oscillospiraceae bacterium]
MDGVIVALDIGSSKVCVAAGRLDKNRKVQILGITSFETYGVKSGVITDIDNVCDAISNAVYKLEQLVDEKINDVIISIPQNICDLVENKGIVAVSSEDKEITENEIEKVLKAAKMINVPSGYEIVDVIPDQFIVDGYNNIKEPLGMSGSKLEVDAKILLCQTTVLNNIFKAVNKASLKVIDIIFEPLAISNATLYKDEKSMGSLIIDVGYDVTKIIVVKEDKIKYLNNINIAGVNISNDLSYCFKISSSEAEKIKLKYSNAYLGILQNSSNVKVVNKNGQDVEIPFKDLIDIMSARVEEILYIIRDKIASEGLLDDISSVVIVGGGISQFNYTETLGRNIFNKIVRIGTTEFVGANNPEFSTAVGTIKTYCRVHNSNYIINSEEGNNYLKSRSKTEEAISESKIGIVRKVKEIFKDFF